MDTNHSESPLDGISSFFGKIFPTKLAINDMLPTNFDLNENSVDLMPSGLNDVDFDRFMDLKSKGKRVYNLSEFIAKDHWELSNVEVCGIDDCEKQLGILNGRQNCFKFNSLIDVESRFALSTPSSK